MSPSVCLLRLYTGTQSLLSHSPTTHSTTTTHALYLHTPTTLVHSPLSLLSFSPLPSTRSPHIKEKDGKKKRELNKPFSHRRRARLPSFPFSSASLLRWLSRREGGRRGVASSSSPSPSVTAPPRAMRARRRAASSSGMESGVPPVPRATGDTLRAERVESVHASMSMVEAAEGLCAWWWATAADDDESVLVGGCFCGGGTSL